MNKSQLTIVKEYKFDNPMITEIDSVSDKRFKDFHSKYFQNFKYE